MASNNLTLADKTLRSGDMAIIISHPVFMKGPAKQNVGIFLTVVSKDSWYHPETGRYNFWTFKNPSRVVKGSEEGGGIFGVPECCLMKIPPPSFEDLEFIEQVKMEEKLRFIVKTPKHSK